MKLQEMGLIVAPESWGEIDHWIGLHDEADRQHLYIAALLAWNYAAKVSKMPEQDITADLENAMNSILGEVK